MTTIVYAGTHGADDPTRATLPFHLANGALEAGFKAQIMLIGDATYLMQESVAQEIRGVAVPPLTELLEKVVAGGAELHI
jgi:uncharacterized protein